MSSITDLNFQFGLKGNKYQHHFVTKKPALVTFIFERKDQLTFLHGTKK